MRSGFFGRAQDRHLLTHPHPDFHSTENGIAFGDTLILTGLGSVSTITGRPYRVYHALPVNGQLHLFVYVNIEDATARQMRMSLVNRREQMVSDGLHIKDDQDHWNAINPKEEQIDLPMDLTLDIDIRRASDSEDETG